jgi:hypothetical protein
VANAPAKWTNPSVRRLGALDPIGEISHRARELVASALDAGWTGPPFNPIGLAETLRLEVRPSDDVRDARTLRSGDRLCIEFNPNRPPARVRFSIAHEIGHTLFPDCGDYVRNRAAYHELTPDGWQLEALCNLAAAEFLMPAGSLPNTSVKAIKIETLVEWRQRYDVSMEALLLRLTRLATSPCAAFCASTRGASLEAASPELRIDYAVASPTWDVRAPQGAVLPHSSVVSECEAVGFTADREEIWPKFGPVHVECIGIPPYPGMLRPRVVGLLRPARDADHESADLGFRVVRGDATRPRGAGTKIIAHVVNDSTPNWGGGGFASALRGRYESAQVAFRDWATSDPRHLRLGELHFCQVAADTRVASLVAQKGYGPSTRSRLRYSALQHSLESLGQRAIAERATVHIPRIGAGQARGSWDLIEGLVREHLCARGISVTVYDLPGAVVPTPEQASLPF